MESECRYNFDFLTNETMELNSQIRELYSSSCHFLKEDCFDEQTLHHLTGDEETEEHDILSTPLAMFPHSSGVIYRINKSLNTFIIKAVAVQDIAAICEGSEILHYKKLAKLDIEDQRECEHLSFFETSSFEEADLVALQFSSKRFPNVDELLYNISDPNESWWLIQEENSFSIHFRTPQIDRNFENTIQLGPVGDVSIFSAMLKKYEVELKTVLDFERFDRSCKFYATSVLYDEFRSLLVDGDERFFLSFHSLNKGLNFYMREIHTFRKFWLTINAELELLN